MVGFIPVWPSWFIFQTAVEQALRRFKIGCSPTVELSMFYLHSSALSLDTGGTRLTKLQRATAFQLPKIWGDYFILEIMMANYCKEQKMLKSRELKKG